MESNDTPQCVRVQGPNGRIVYKLGRCTGPTFDMQAGPKQEWQHKSLVCCMAQEGSEEGINEEKDEEIATEKDVQVMAKEQLEEIKLGSNLQEQRPISISLRLSEKEKSKIDIFAERVQRCLRIGLQRNAKIGSWASGAHIKCGPRGQANGLACKYFPH